MPFLLLIPGSGSFWFTRIVIEPILVFIAAIVLEDFFIIQPGLSYSLRFAALTMMMKNFVGRYRAWEYLRKLLDAENAGPSFPSSSRTR